MGRKPKKIKVTYKYVGDESPEAKVEAEKRVEEVFDMIFDEAWKNIKEKKSVKLQNSK